MSQPHENHLYNLDDPECPWFLKEGLGEEFLFMQKQTLQQYIVEKTEMQKKLDDFLDLMCFKTKAVDEYKIDFVKNIRSIIQYHTLQLNILKLNITNKAKELTADSSALTLLRERGYDTSGLQILFAEKTKEIERLVKQKEERLEQIGKWNELLPKMETFDPL
jgi:hypothetical protein